MPQRLEAENTRHQAIAKRRPVKRAVATKESWDRKRETDQNPADKTWRDDSRERGANDPDERVKNEVDGESDSDPLWPDASRAETGCHGEQDHGRDVDGEPGLVGEIGSGME